MDNEGLAELVVLTAALTLGSPRGAVAFDCGLFDVGDIHRAIRSRVDYVPDVGGASQRIRAPWVTLDQGAGDCKSTAILALAMAEQCGLRAFLRFYDQTGGGWDHVVAVVEGVVCDPLLPLGSEVDAARIRDVYI